MNVSAFAAFEVDPGVVEVRAEVGVAGLGIGQQVPDDDHDGAADRDDGLFLASSAGDAPVTFTEEGVGASGADSGLAQQPGQVAVAVPGAATALLLPGGLADSRGEPGPGREMPRGREAGHVQPDLSDHPGRGDGPEPGDLIDPLDRGDER